MSVLHRDGVTTPMGSCVENPDATGSDLQYNEYVGELIFTLGACALMQCRSCSLAVYDESQVDMKFVCLVKFNFAEDAPAE
jgi:hypothetical protein